MRLVLGLLLLLGAAAPAAAQTQVIGGSTTITAPEAGGVAGVRIPVDVGLPSIAWYERTFTFTPPDRAAVMVLRRRGPAADPFVAVVAMQPAPGLVPCLGLDCESPLMWVYATDRKGYMDGEVPKVRVPAGDYDLYLVAEGGPAQLRLVLPELGGADGALSLAPTDGAEVRTLVELEGAGRILGVSGTLARPGMHAILLRAMSASSAATVIETCRYDGEPQGALAYAPTCPGAADSFSFAAASSSQVALGSVIFGAPAGSFGIGGNLIDAGPSFFDGLAAWLPYRPAEPASSPAPPAPPATVHAPVAPGGGVKILTRRGRARRGRIDVRLRCSQHAPCRGLLRSPHIRQKRFQLAPGTARTVRVRLRGRPRVLTLEAVGPGGVRVRKRVRVIQTRVR